MTEIDGAPSILLTLNVHKMAKCTFKNFHNLLQNYYRVFDLFFFEIRPYRVRDHLFGTYAKFLEKLTLPSDRYMCICVSGSTKCYVFRKILLTYQIDDLLRQCRFGTNSFRWF